MRHFPKVSANSKMQWFEIRLYNWEGKKKTLYTFIFNIIFKFPEETEQIKGKFRVGERNSKPKSWGYVAKESPWADLITL